MRFDRMLRQSLALAAALTVTTIWPAAPAVAADKNIDLDGNTVNGAESNAALNVVTTYPTKIKDKVTSKAVGQAFRFSWAGGGPGGFFSSVPAGSTAGVGAIWTWETTQSVFSINADITFTQTSPGTVTRTFTGLPGRSLTSSGVTTSSASLTSSLITFFSPQEEQVRVTSRVTPVAGGLFKYVTEITNFTDDPIDFAWAPGPLGCDSETCGNDVREGSEQCDGSDLDGASCDIFGGTGTLSCTEGCEYDLSGCSICGNGELESGEACDGTDLGEESCTSQGYDGGTLACDDGCGFDYDGCTVGDCGNGVIEGSEVCDTSELNGQTCVTQGHACGLLACQPDCSGYDDTDCSDLCFDGIQSSPDSASSPGAVSPGGSTLRAASSSRAGRASGRTPRTTASSLASSARLARRSAVGRAVDPRGTLRTAPVGKNPCDFDGLSGRIEGGAKERTSCKVSVHPAKEVTSQVVVCGNGLPSGPQGCGTNPDSGTQGTANVLEPDENVDIGDIFLSPFHVAIQDGSNGFAEPGETIRVFISLINTGPRDLTNAVGTLSVVPQDIDGDGTPDAAVVTQATSPYPTIPGIPSGGGDCDSADALLHPVYNINPFIVTLPAGYPIDSNLKFILTVDGVPATAVAVGAFTQDVAVVMGVGLACSLTNLDGSYTKVEGFLSPMGPLVPSGDPFPTSTNASTSRTQPLKVRLFCGTKNLTDSDVAAPQIVSLTRDGVPIDVNKVDLEDNANNHTLSFRYASGFWLYNLRSKLLGHGTFVITIRFANGQEYQSQFVL